MLVEEASRESGSIIFEAIDGLGGIYFVYYLPYAMLGKPPLSPGAVPPASSGRRPCLGCRPRAFSVGSGEA